MNKIYFLIGTMLFLINTNAVSMADLGLAFRYIVQAMQPACRVAKDIESHGCICKKKIERVSYFTNDGYEYYCSQLSFDDWLVARKDIAGISKGAIVCLRYFKTLEGTDWISFPVDKSTFFMLQKKYMLISASRTDVY